uniref:Transmembrane protein n=2 Tax=Opuntia streptacantha TaxID=393608 RepID=A0A7C9F7Q8_OPUST
MSWKMWEKKKGFGIANAEVFDYPVVVRPFYLLSITLLSLLLPLSYLLLARLSSAHYLLSLASNPPPTSLLSSLFLYSNPNLLHALVCAVTLAALVNSLMGRISPFGELAGLIFQPRVHAAWIFLCTLQVCVGLGIEATINEGVDGTEFGDGKTILSKLVFFLGLHETMIHWSRAIVRPVVDDTIFGGPQEERWAERWALAASFGALSWWRLRDEVESLVVVVEFKRDLMIKVGFGDFLAWWLYYLTVAIGMARILKAIMWFCMLLFCRSPLDESHPHQLYADEIRENEDKV